MPKFVITLFMECKEHANFALRGSILSAANGVSEIMLYCTTNFNR